MNRRKIVDANEFTRSIVVAVAVVVVTTAVCVVVTSLCLCVFRLWAIFLMRVRVNSCDCVRRLSSSSEKKHTKIIYVRTSTAHDDDFAEAEKNYEKNEQNDKQRRKKKNGRFRQWTEMSPNIAIKHSALATSKSIHIEVGTERGSTGSRRCSRNMRESHVDKRNSNRQETLEK